MDDLEPDQREPDHREPDQREPDQREPGHLEHELRDVLTHQRRALSTDLVSLDAVYAGAVRRRHRRTAVLSAAGAVVLAAVAVPASLALLDARRGPSPIEAAVSASPNVAAPSNAASTTPTAPAPSASSVIPDSPPWGGAHVTSVTATSTRTIVVLGFLGDTGACAPPDCLRLVQSRDGGKTFTSLPVPAEAAAAGTDGSTRAGATDVRFGSASDGWLFGNGLWATHDGARTWHPVTLPGAVTRLAAAHGTVWALVSDDGGDSQQLWRSAVGSDSWTQVPDVTVGGPGDLALVGSRVVVLGVGPSKVWVSKDGSSFTGYTSPCTTALEAELSASTSLWAKCVTGTEAFVVTSTDGVAWRPVKAAADGGGAPNSLALGARGPDDALLALAASQPLSDLSNDGSRKPVSKPPTVGSPISYLGFTSVDVGYAIDGADLWRTKDGGDTWTRLKIG
jgi:hypothetical protein